MTAHTAIRPSIEQLWRQWKQEQALGNCHVALYDACDDFAKREALWSAYEENAAYQRRYAGEVMEQLDRTFGPGMGEAIKEMIGG